MAYNKVKVKARQVVSTNTQTKDLGTVSEVPMGLWNATTQYQKLNKVRYVSTGGSGVTLLAKKANQGIEPFVSQGWQDIWMVENYDGGSVIPNGTYPDMTVGNATDAQNDGTGTNIAEQFTNINEKIPSTASAENQLADKAFVNSSINNMAAFYITSNAGGDAFATRASLLNAAVYYYGGEPRTPTQNDYAIVLADESQPKGVDSNYPTTRYTYQGGEWAFQYVVNNTSLTQAQVDAINSGITAQKISDLDNATAAKYTKPSTGIPESDLSSGVQTKLNKMGGVTGVKGANETTYRTGNVNLTAEDIGAPEAKNTIYGANPKDLDLNMEFDDEFLLAHGYMGSIHVNGNPDWYNLINVRHRNGQDDGDLYGLQIRKALTVTGSPLQYRAQTGGDWEAWETVYSSSNPPYETGNNSGTNWIRFKNGVQICWGYFNNGSNTRDKVFQVSFGKAFSAPPCLVLTSGKTDGDSSYRSTYSNYYQITNTWANVGWYGENASSLCWIAIGTYA